MNYLLYSKEVNKIGQKRAGLVARTMRDCKGRQRAEVMAHPDMIFIRGQTSELDQDFVHSLFLFGF